MSLNRDDNATYSALRFGGLAVFITISLAVFMWAVIVMYFDPTFEKRMFVPRQTHNVVR